VTDAAAEGSVAGRELGYLLALARAAAGALIFALPLFMTQEMWELGAGLDRYRMALFLVLAVPLLTGLNWYAGFRDEVGWTDALLDAFASYAVGFLVSVLCLLMLGVLELTTLSLSDIGTVAIQAVPSAFGAALAQSQLQATSEDCKDRRNRTSYWGELFLMTAGALFIAFNIAPTEEVQRLTYGLEGWQFPVIVLVTLLVMHAFVYGVEFSGQETRPEHRSFMSEVVLYTVTGYVLSLLVCLYILWTLGRLDGQGALPLLQMLVVLGFPAAIGAAAARLIL
jgi:putative integral membrane protein (TIGR02587 family)